MAIIHYYPLTVHRRADPLLGHLCGAYRNDTRIIPAPGSYTSPCGLLWRRASVAQPLHSLSFLVYSPCGLTLAPVC